MTSVSNVASVTSMLTAATIGAVSAVPSGAAASVARPMAIYELIERPDLEHPVLVLGLDGWIDAGLAGSHAVETITSGLDMATVATFDADVLLDHRARRPTMHLDEGLNTGLTWPSIELRAATDRQGNEALLLLGVEPDHTWGAFSRAVVDLAVEFGCRMAVGLGAYPARSPTPGPPA